jgi:threonine dehydrogenase-like Zn-dependent dehydrogenase
VDVSPERLALVREKGLADEALASDASALGNIRRLTDGKGCEKTVDCSGSKQGRLLAIQATRNWGKSVMIGEDGEATFRPSADFMHEHKTLYGSWVTSTWRMEELVERMVRWDIHPDALITTRLPLEKVSEGFALMDEGKCGKVAICFDEELK